MSRIRAILATVLLSIAENAWADTPDRFLNQRAEFAKYHRQITHWGPEEWRREIDWCLKKRLNVVMLRIGQDDLFARTFPSVSFPDSGMEGMSRRSGFNDRIPFWPLSFRGRMRSEIQEYGRGRGILFPEDFGTMTHWYSPTPWGGTTAMRISSPRGEGRSRTFGLN